MIKKFFFFFILLACSFWVYAQDARTAKIEVIKKELSDYMAAHKGKRHSAEIEGMIQQKLNMQEPGHALTAAQKKQAAEELNAFYWENQFWKAHPAYETYISQRDVGAMSNLCANGGFENGNTAFTHFGSTATGGSNNCTVAGTIPFNPTLTTSSIGSVANRMEVVSAANDPLVPALFTTRSGSRALRINSRLNAAGVPCTPDLQNISFGSEIDKAATTFKVSDTATTLSFWFAAVMQFPNHDESNGRNPFFTARLRDDVTGAVQTICLDPAQNNMQNGGTVCMNPLVWQPWRCGVFDLVAARGHKVTLEFLAADCLFAAHFGYAYIDDICVDCAAPGSIGNITIATTDDCYTDGITYTGTISMPTFPGATLNGMIVQLRRNGVTLAAHQNPTIVGNTFTGTFPANLFVEGNMYDLVVRAFFTANNMNGIALVNEIVPGINNDFKATKEGCCDSTDTPNFTIQTSCSNGVFTVMLTGTDTGPRDHFWGLYQTATPVATGGTLVAQSTAGITATFTITDFSKYYYVKHGIRDTCYPLRETTTLVPLPQANFDFKFLDSNNVPKTTFCFGETIKLSATMGTNVTGYYIDAWRTPINGGPQSWYAGLGWFTGQPGTIDLTAAFGGLSNPAFFEPGYVYEIKLAVSNPNLCIGWSEQKRSFKVICCDSFFNPKFQLDPEPNPGQPSNTLWAINFNTYWPMAGVVHEWYVLSSPNPSGGPYTLVTTVTSTFQDSVKLYSNAQYGVQYKVIHKIKTKCGEYCFAQTDCANCRTADAIGTVDCSILDGLLCTPPTGLFGSCARNILVWNPVATAAGYVVEISYNDPACCRSNYPPVGMRYELRSPNLPLGSIITPQYDCFRWRVMARCANGATSAWSDWQCFEACNPTGDCEPPKVLKSSCADQLLGWEQVPDAQTYLVELSLNDPNCCRSEYKQVSWFEKTADPKLYIKGLDLPNFDCIRWRVSAYCKDRYGDWSDWQCFSCLSEDGVQEVDAEVYAMPAKTKVKATLRPRIAPNPNKGEMTLSMQAPGDLVLSVDVINAQGSRVKTIARNTYKGGQFNAQLSLGAAAKGVYTVVFHTNYGTFRKKVIVQ